MSYENLFGGADLSEYKTVEIMFESGENEVLEKPQFIGIVGDFLFVESETQYLAIKKDGLYKVTLHK